MIAKDIATLILAAGASSRMGRPKALLPWGNTTVLENILSELDVAGLRDIVLVSGAHHKQISEGLAKKNIRICFNKGWEAGMGSSLKTGVQHIEDAYPEKHGLLVLLSDQPLISGAYLKEMLGSSQMHPGHIIATAYGKGEGVPALFPRSFWSSMAQIPPEKGAKVLIRAHRDRTVLLDAGEAIMDMDTPEAYREILQKAGLNSG
jgi:molybdenum cofactor cytidylyltransferase